ncbi:hypothetical protein [Clostridium frigidicarnis]|uniref:YCII-related domain-containing protein n=1 Tax=Clostridium frigidicarnis TaxID=84698 RepID=A0A1I0YQM8_9CLOT|nr:hypothetical protein [Clostridium frigidicarnis]SFB15624.1 hypothetical protein SAMN04488528_101489 [Clostridium frigidicarnis]
MQKRDGLFVKINYKMDYIKGNQKRDLKENKNNINLTKYLYCAGTYNKNGGTMIFRAENIDEAKFIIDNNPFSQMATYNYEILSKNKINLLM